MGDYDNNPFQHSKSNISILPIIKPIIINGKSSAVKNLFSVYEIKTMLFYV